MTRLAILWHMHQPYYEDLATGEHVLPWVRLHAIKDYVGMVALLDEFPSVRLTFNLVPSLLVQIAAFAEERAEDRLLRVGLQPAEALSDADRQFLVANGFHVPGDRMIRPYPRYAELHARRFAGAAFTVEDLRDLQVWHKLVWMDPDWRATDSRLLALAAKARGFDEHDKQTLRRIELELLRQVVPAYRAAAARGQIEVSTSPFYHPILPLLCDSDVHHEMHPQTAMARGVFAWPADAREQVHRARAYHREVFGVEPAGIWPSEGSLSTEAYAILADAGFEWTASDQEILSRSLGSRAGPRQLYQPYEVGSTGPLLRCLFRDHDLSDRIGFVYQSWDASRAADDFVGAVRSAAAGCGVERGAGAFEPVITVILDGENAWEHYPEGGRPFLRALYGRLQQAADIETLTLGAAARRPAGRLDRLAAGSWINGDFYIWAGHADDHRAWSQLAAARRRFDELADGVSDEARRRAYDELLIAEGSDWFWWYGDDHSSDQDAEFDDLFRRHVRNAYAALGVKPPADLFVSNITTGGARDRITLRGFSRPRMDGDGRYGDWVHSVAVGGGGGSMHRVGDRVIEEMRVGADRSVLYLRLAGRLVDRLSAGLRLALLVTEPLPARLDLWPQADGAHVVIGRVVEAAVPFNCLGVQAGDRVRFAVLVTDADGAVVDHQPPSPVALERPTRHLEAANWVV
jgi:alpha-amylase/alpha-mannosidase (GH57 family)